MLSKCSACLLVSGLVATMASGQTAGGLVAKNNQAEGGAKLRSVKTVRLTGTLTVGGTEAEPLLMEWVAPSHKVRMEVTVKGAVDTRAYDGAIGWAVLRSEGKTEPERLTGDALRDMKATADFQGALFDPDSKGNEVEYLGKSELAGQPVYKLKLTRSDGEERTIYLDATTYLEIREDATHGGRNDTTEDVTTFGDFRTVDGITVPFRIETKEKQTLGGGMIRMEGSVLISFEKIELNVDIPASHFSKPHAEASKG